MANLRTNNLCGEGGKRAYRGSVFFDGRDDVTVLQVIAADGNDDFTFGTGDFTIEFWVLQSVRNTTASLYGGRRDADDEVAPVIYLNSGVATYYTAGSNRITGSSTLTVNTWHHIAVARQSGSTKLYVNGIQEGSTYSDSNSYVAKLNRPTIGAEGRVFGNNPLKGYLSNVRVCKGHAVYTANFEPPTSELKVHYLTDDDKTVLLCCQDSDNPMQEATGKELLGQGGVYYGKRFSNLATNGNLETGTTTNWTNAGCATFEISNFSHSGSYSIHAVSDGNGDAIVYTIPVTLDTQRRYKISAYINCVGPGGTSAKAKMKIGSGTAGNENYESQTADVGAGWVYVEWIGLATSDTTHVTFNESSANNVNDWYVDDLKIELWYPEEGVNILANPDFLTGATGWSFSSTPSGEFSIGSNKLSVADNSRTSDAFATQSLFPGDIAEGRYKVTIDYSISSGDFDLGIGNNRLFGIALTHDGGAGNTSSFTGFIDAGGSSTLFRIVANQHNVGDFFNINLSRVAEPKAPKVLPPYGVDAGNTFNGAISMNSPSYMFFPTGRKEERGRGRVIVFGNSSVNSSFEMSTGGKATKFGNANFTIADQHASCSSSTRAVRLNGYSPSPAPIACNVMEFVTIATESNATDFGDSTRACRYNAGFGSPTRGINANGNTPGAQNTIDYITIASIGDAIDFGDLLNFTQTLAGATSNTTRGLISGESPGSNITEYITIATTGNAQDFGDATVAMEGRKGAADSTRALFASGYSHPTFQTINTIDYFTIATTGNAIDFGDMTYISGAAGGTSDSTRAVFMGGFTTPGQTTDTIDVVTIQTTGDAVEFGDMYATGSTADAATSDSHGGIS